VRTGMMKLTEINWEGFRFCGGPGGRDMQGPFLGAAAFLRDSGGLG
jgi:hypothetical protein